MIMRRVLVGALATVGFLAGTPAAAVTATGTVEPGKFSAPPYMHAQLKPSETFYTSTVPRTSWDSGSGVTPDFDIVQGSIAPGADLAGRNREWAIAKFLIDSQDGFVSKVELGYQLASGRNPIVAGRRVRAASDGTQFAIEVFQVVTVTEVTTYERVHLFTVADGKELKVHVYAAEDLAQTGATIAEISLKTPFDYCELKEVRNLATGAVTASDPTQNNSGTAAGADVVHFQLEMLKLIGYAGFPPDAAVAPAAVASTASFADVVELSKEEFALPQLQARGSVRLLDRFKGKFPPGTKFLIPAGLIKEPLPRAPLPRPPAKNPGQEKPGDGGRK